MLSCTVEWGSFSLGQVTATVSVVEAREVLEWCTLLAIVFPEATYLSIPHFIG